MPVLWTRFQFGGYFAELAPDLFEALMEVRGNAQDRDLSLFELSGGLLVEVFAESDVRSAEFVHSILLCNRSGLPLPKYNS